MDMSQSGQDFYYQLIHPFQALIIGQSGSGKSFLLADIVRNYKTIIHPLIEKIVYCYSVPSESYFTLQKECPILELHHGAKFDVNESDTTVPTLTIFDDFHGDLAKKEFEDLFLYNARHRNQSVIICMHSIFPKNCRTLSLNAKYVALFASSRDNLQVRTLSSQCGMHGGKYLLSCYNICKQKPHGYIFCDFSQDQNDLYRIRSSIIPDENCTVFAPLI